MSYREDWERERDADWRARLRVLRSRMRKAARSMIIWNPLGLLGSGFLVFSGITALINIAKRAKSPDAVAPSIQYTVVGITTLVAAMFLSCLWGWRDACRRYREARDDLLDQGEHVGLTPAMRAALVGLVGGLITATALLVVNWDKVLDLYDRVAHK